jgi:hypothetical protein
MTRKIKSLIKDFSISSFNYSGGMGGGEAGVDPPTTTKGDVSGYDTTFARIPIGSDTQVLTADSAQALGLKWAAPNSTVDGGIEPLSYLGKRTICDTSGSVIPVQWTLVNTVGTATNGISDGINKGIFLKADTTTKTEANVSFNNIRNVDSGNFVGYMIFQVVVASNNSQHFGIASDKNAMPQLGVGTDWVMVLDDTASDYQFSVKGAGTESKTATGVTTSTNKVSWKIENDGTTCKASYLTGGVWVLKASDTTNLPTVAMQPIFGLRDDALHTAHLELINAEFINTV